MKSDSKLKLSRTALFPALSCFPLSPVKSKDADEQQSIDSEDLMLKIFKILGAQGIDDMDFIKDQNI